MFRDISELTRAIPGLEIECETKFPITTTPAVVHYTVRLHGVRVLEDASEERFREFVTFLLLHKPTQSKINWDSIIDGTSIQTALINALKKIAKQQPFLAYAEETTYGTQPEKPAWQPYPGPTPTDLLQRLRHMLQGYRDKNDQVLGDQMLAVVLNDLLKACDGVKPDPVRTMIDRIEARADEALRKYPTGMPINKDAATLVAIRQMCREVK